MIRRPCPGRDRAWLRPHRCRPLARPPQRRGAGPPSSWAITAYPRTRLRFRRGAAQHGDPRFHPRGSSRLCPPGDSASSPSTRWANGSKPGPRRPRRRDFRRRLRGLLRERLPAAAADGHPRRGLRGHHPSRQFRGVPPRSHLPGARPGHSARVGVDEELVAGIYVAQVPDPAFAATRAALPLPGSDLASPPLRRARGGVRRRRRNPPRARCPGTSSLHMSAARRRLAHAHPHAPHP